MPTGRIDTFAALPVVNAALVRHPARQGYPAGNRSELARFESGHLPISSDDWDDNSQVMRENQRSSELCAFTRYLVDHCPGVGVGAGPGIRHCAGGLVQAGEGLPTCTCG